MEGPTVSLQWSSKLRDLDKLATRKPDHRGLDREDRSALMSASVPLTLKMRPGTKAVRRNKFFLDSYGRNMPTLDPEMLNAATPR